MPQQLEVLETPRLKLRRPEPGDAADVFRILTDDLVLEHNPSDRLTDLTEAETLIAQWSRHWEEHGFGNACVVYRDTGQLIANCGVRWMELPQHRVLNLMYRFLPSTWRRGLATEAAGALLDWVQLNLPETIVLARIRPANLASRAVATRIGLQRDLELDDLGQDGIDWAFSNRSSLAHPD